MILNDDAGCLVFVDDPIRSTLYFYFEVVKKMDEDDKFVLVRLGHHIQCDECVMYLDGVCNLAKRKTDATSIESRLEEHEVRSSR
jgi:hypothetical protein